MFAWMEYYFWNVPGEADTEVQKRSGLKIYNVKFTFGLLEDNTTEGEKKEGEAEKVDSDGISQLYGVYAQQNIEFHEHGVVYAEGRKCSMKGMAGVSGLEKISEEEYEQIMNDGDPIEAPPGPYKVQPNVKGKIYTHLPYLRYSGNYSKSSKGKLKSN